MSCAPSLNEESVVSTTWYDLEKRVHRAYRMLRQRGEYDTASWLINRWHGWSIRHGYKSAAERAARR